MENSKRGLNEFVENVESKLKNSFSLIKKDINEIKSNIKDENLLSDIQSIQQKFKGEIKRYKEETRLIREVLKSQESRIRALENNNALEADEPKFWGSSISP